MTIINGPQAAVSIEAGDRVVRLFFSRQEFESLIRCDDHLRIQCIGGVIELELLSDGAAA